MPELIPFNRPARTGAEDEFVASAMGSAKISGDGEFGKRCQQWFVSRLGCDAAMLTPSCTHALEMSALLLDIQPGDEVIMPSYTFVSTANAFVLRGAKIVFVDIRPDTMNIDENLVEAAITAKTRAIVVVHYAGVACEMDALMSIAAAHKLWLVEDAAQAMMSTYKGRLLGTFGKLAAYSFHETKNFTSAGEGGLLIVNDPALTRRAEIIREKGTNRSQFFRGMVDKYSWVDVGSSYLLSDVQAAYLWGQLTVADEIIRDRYVTWNAYHAAFSDLEAVGRVARPVVPVECAHNAHMYYLKVRDLVDRTAFLAHLDAAGVMGVFHYVPLHSSLAGRRFGTFSGEDRHTTRESERLVRLPLWYGMTLEERGRVIDAVRSYFE